MDRIWIVDNQPSQKYPIYTRGNVGEVFPEAVAPLSWTLGGIPSADPGWKDALVRFGAFDHDEFDEGNLNPLGVFGGYAYLNVSIARIFAVRTPGLTPDLMDQALFGASQAPAYRPLPTDEDEAKTGAVSRTLGWILTVDDLPGLLDDQREVDDYVAARPELAQLSLAQLLAHARERMGLFRRLFAEHIFITNAATVPVGIIQGVAAEMGDPTMAMTLVAGIGGVDSAAPSWALWNLSRIDDETKFELAFAEFLEAFGSRGPNEWEISAPTWGTRPELARLAIDRMRAAPDEAAPQRHFEDRAAEREALTAQVIDALAPNPEIQAQFMAAVRAAGIFLAGRERTKTTIIKLTHEARLAFHEIARRLMVDGHLERFEDFAMVTNEEYDDFIADPARYADTIRERRQLFERLQRLEPPFIIDGEVPPLEEWTERGSAPVEPARPGEPLVGIPGCPGSYTGRARVVLRPDEAHSLQPGDVLVAPITDPAWTPLFVPAGAVVVDVGAQISHAVIVSRELGIPCVVSVTDGTRRIPDGATITVDGTTGTVTLH